MPEDKSRPVPPTISVHADARSAAEEGARRFAEHARAAVRSRGRFAVALSGGNTPCRLYAALAREPLGGQVPWAATHVFWGDERHVPHDCPESNYRLARETLLQHVPVPPAQVHRVPTNLPPAEAAATYSSELRSALGGEGLDLVLLGMGGDGHVASLFPGTDALLATQRGAVAVFVPQLESWRISLTLPEINASRAVIFLVAGREKASAVAEAISGNTCAPAAQVIPAGEKVVWILDLASASRIPNSAITGRGHDG